MTLLIKHREDPSQFILRVVHSVYQIMRRSTYYVHSNLLSRVQSQDKLLEVNGSTSIVIKYPEQSLH